MYQRSYSLPPNYQGTAFNPPPEEKHEKVESPSLPINTESDDILLCALIIMLLQSHCEDELLIILLLLLLI